MKTNCGKGNDSLAAAVVAVVTAAGAEGNLFVAREETVFGLSTV